MREHDRCAQVDVDARDRSRSTAEALDVTGGRQAPRWRPGCRCRLLSAARRATASRSARSTATDVAPSSAASGSSTSVRRPVRTSCRARARETPRDRVTDAACRACQQDLSAQFAPCLDAILRAVTPSRVIALFGPTGVGKTDVALALAELLRRAGSTRSRCRPTRCRSTRASRSSPASPRPPSRQRLEHRLRLLPAGRRALQRGRVRRAGPRRDRRPRSRRARPRSSSAGTGLYLRAALAELDLRPAPPDERAPPLDRRARRARARGAARASSPAARPRPRRRSTRATASGSCARSSSTSSASSSATAGGQPALDRATPATRPRSSASRWNATRSTRASTHACGRWSPPARWRRSAAARRRARRRPRARPSGSTSCWPATSRPCSAARAPTPSASSRGCASSPASTSST